MELWRTESTYENESSTKPTYLAHALEAFRAVNKIVVLEHAGGMLRSVSLSKTAGREPSFQLPETARANL
jgi:hypothetical protein